MGDMGDGPSGMVTAKMPNPRSGRRQTIVLGECEWERLGLSLAVPLGGTKKGKALYAKMFDEGRVLGRDLDRVIKAERAKQHVLTESIEKGTTRSDEARKREAKRARGGDGAEGTG